MLKLISIIFVVVLMRKVAEAVEPFCDCGPNEHLNNCSPTCPPETCAAIGRQYKCPAQPPPDCQPSCKCNLNYRRDEWGECIPIQDCPPLECPGQNEVYNPCPRICPGDTCQDASLNGVCPFRIGIILICEPACTCAEGFYRQNDTGLCIPQRNCFSCTGKNEEFRQSGPAIQPTCENLYAHNTGLFARQRRSGCYCKEGFIRDLNNKCIDVKNCYRELCGTNEVRSCGPACDTTCATLNETCPIINVQCNDMCYCREGYARDDCGGCIPVEQCPDKCTEPNEEWSRNVDCNCDDLDICDSYIGDGTAGCRCIDGYVRDINGICIQAGTCPRCGPLEEYTECGSACEAICNRPLQNLFCIEVCVKGCFCKPGLLRDKNGKCVEPDQCSAVGCNGDFYATEVLRPSPCPDTCTNYMQTDRVCLQFCKEFGCQCNEGFVLDETTNQCILPANCHKCMEQNEIYSNGFDVTCIERDSPNFENLLKTRKPALGCHCKVDHIRDASNQCIPAHLCQRCGPLEEFKECGSACPASCSNLDEPGRACTKQCVVGCFCRSPLVRNAKGECVQPEKCPSAPGCGGDINASKKNYVIGCVPTCDNPKALEDCVDVPSNRSSGCVCNEGFVYDGVSKKCIPPSHCLPGCGGDVNALFLPCGNNCPVTCDNLSDPPLCPQLCRINAGECGCKANFVQDERGRCVKPSQCNNL